MGCCGILTAGNNYFQQLERYFFEPASDLEKMLPVLVGYRIAIARCSGMQNLMTSTCGNMLHLMGSGLAQLRAALWLYKYLLNSSRSCSSLYVDKQVDACKCTCKAQGYPDTWKSMYTDPAIAA